MRKFERARSARAAVAAIVTDDDATEVATSSDGGSGKGELSSQSAESAPRRPVGILDTERITIYLPTDLVDRVERRIAEIRRRHRVSVSGYIEAALYEFMSAGDSDVAHLKKHHVKARRSRT